VRDEIDLRRTAVHPFDRRRTALESEHLRGGKDVDAAQVEVRIRRWKPVQVRAADRCEEKRIRMRCDRLPHRRMPRQLFTIASRAFRRNAFARAKSGCSGSRVTRNASSNSLSAFMLDVTDSTGVWVEDLHDAALMLDSSLLEKWIETFYGYGSWNSPS
jgi:hypothetical protein